MARSSTDKRHFIIVSFLIVIFTFILYWLLQAGLPLPAAASEQAKTIDSMFDIHLFLIAFLFALICVFMVYALIVFRKKAHEADDVTGEHFHGNTWLEIAWTGIPTLFVIGFCFYGVSTLNEVTRAKANEVVVNVESKQWSFYFKYPEGDYPVAFESSELVLPLGEPALMKLNSEDVLHAFWVAEFRVKQDIVPGQITEVRFTPNKAGEYKLRCAELCGTTHAGMISNVRVLEKADYEAWLNEQIAKVDPALASQE